MSEVPLVGNVSQHYFIGDQVAIKTAEQGVAKGRVGIEEKAISCCADVANGIELTFCIQDCRADKEVTKSRGQGR